jgi:hypothetical protein
MSGWKLSLVVLLGCAGESVDGVTDVDAADTDTDVDTDTDTDVDTDTDTDTDPVTLYSVASFFGECVGACQHTVTFDDGVSLTIEGWSTTGALATQSGTLTSAGDAELRRVDADLVAATLEETYGCPDCADGGGMRLLLGRSASAPEHTWEYGNPPPVLVDVDALFHDLRDALVDCSGSPWVTPDAGCMPFTP